MHLKTIETFTNQDVGFVRVTAEDGSQGWGQVPHITLTLHVRYYTVRLLLGH